MDTAHTPPRSRTITYNMDNPNSGVRECPRCHRTMERLRAYNAIDRQEGYLLDDGTDNYQATYIVGGWQAALLHYLYRQIIEPITYMLFGRLKKRRYERIESDFPNSLICLHCRYLWKRK